MVSHDQIQVERIQSLSQEAISILNEYYEAIDVVVRDSPDALGRLVTARGGGIWLARLNDLVAGCVVLRRLSSDACECKRLFVRPAARGNKIGDRLMSAVEQYARDIGHSWIYLDSHDGLRTAITLYRQRGYENCERYNDNPQASVFLRKWLG